MTNKTIRELQSSLPWTVHYHHDFRQSPMTHKDFGHALVHVLKAAGKIASVVNDAEHGGSDFKPEEVDRFVADLVVCALRMANTCPGHVIDLQSEVENRIRAKNALEVKGEPQGNTLEHGPGCARNINPNFLCTCGRDTATPSMP